MIHRAFEQPGRFVRQVASMPDGRSYLWMARTVQGAVHGFAAPRKEFAVGLDLPPESATPIGPDCTSCPRSGCPQRAFPQSQRPLALDLNVTPEDPYRTIDGK